MYSKYNFNFQNRNKNNYLIKNLYYAFQIQFQIFFLLPNMYFKINFIVFSPCFQII